MCGLAVGVVPVSVITYLLYAKCIIHTVQYIYLLKVVPEHYMGSSHVLVTLFVKTVQFLLC